MARTPPSGLYELTAVLTNRLLMHKPGPGSHRADKLSGISMAVPRSGMSGEKWAKRPRVRRLACTGLPRPAAGPRSGR